MTTVSASTALFRVRCPACGGTLPEPMAPFGSPYVTTVTHRHGRDRCRVAVRVSSTGTLARELPDYMSYEMALLQARRELGLGKE